MKKHKHLLCGIRHFGESAIDGGVAWAVYSNSMTDAEILRDTGWTAYNGGLGRYFTDSPFVKRGKYRAIITQRFGIDA